jgi:hypothetical protein
MFTIYQIPFTITGMIDGFKSQRSGVPRGKAKITRETEKDEPAFRPPEDVAELPEPAEKPRFSDTADAPVKKHRKNPVQWFKGLSKKQKIITAILLVLLLAGIGGGVYALLNKPAPPPAPVVEVKKEEPVKETPIYSPLTGVVVTKEQSQLPVIGVMVENSPDARPQSGLHQAGVVFEAIAEGGITRFLTLFQESQPDYIGPIRSVRPYYVDWLQGFDAAIAHVGGSADALAKIRNEGVKDLDQFSNSGPYRRVSNRYAPHNMYSSLGGLTDLAKGKGWTTSSFTGFPRKAEKPSEAPTARTIDITISGALYNVHYDYDLASNSYKRVLAGKPHIDERSKTQIAPKVVIAIVVPFGIAANGVNSTYQTIGNGKAFIFQDGVAAEGTWEKTSGKSQITFKDATGAPIPFNAGQTWITATSIANNVVYKP